jgi:hypothetical protein
MRVNHEDPALHTPNELLVCNRVGLAYRIYRFTSRVHSSLTFCSNYWNIYYKRIYMIHIYAGMRLSWGCAPEDVCSVS